ncbi:hypothetical protein WMF45_12310 [Sorangium sp. So ce448]|uniref:hypothetical protein n=1 Tax=Sorangium sp. So ce448 TaxID=3133314 RepID=UPI003F62C56B
MRMVFRGGAAYGPNGRFGAWVVSVGAGGSVTLAGQALGEEIHRGGRPAHDGAAMTAADVSVGHAGSTLRTPCSISVGRQRNTAGGILDACFLRA